MVPTEDSLANEKDIFMLLEGINNGIPSNVVSDVNPYQYHPSALPEGIWFLTKSEVKKESDFGYWMTKTEGSQIFSDSLVTGWRRTLEFVEGQNTNSGNEANWVSQEYWLTRRKILSQDVNIKESFLLCSVSFIGEKNPNHEGMEKNVDFVDTAGQPTNSAARIVSENDSGKGSTSKAQDDIDGTRSNVRVTDLVSNNHVDIVPEVDYLNGGDYLELLDLENPPSPTCSLTSSCMTMSSDEYFDVLDLLRDRESEKDHESAQNSASFKLCVFESSRPNETLVSPASTGTLAEEFNKSQRNDVGTEAMASTSRNPAVAEEEKKMVRGRMKKIKKKYLCFMPF